MRLNAQHQRLCRKTVIHMFIACVQDDLSVRKSLVQRAGPANMVEMAMGQSYGLQCQFVSSDIRLELVRLLPWIDADSPPGVFAANDSRVLLKGGQDKLFDDHRSGKLIKRRRDVKFL